MILRKSFYIRWSAGRSPRVHEVNPGRDPSLCLPKKTFQARRAKRCILTRRVRPKEGFLGYGAV